VTVVYIADRITNEFEMADLYGDVSIVPSESSTVSPTECPSMKLSGKVNIFPIYRPSLSHVGKPARPRLANFFLFVVLLGSLESPSSIMVTRNLWSARV